MSNDRRTLDQLRFTATVGMTVSVLVSVIWIVFTVTSNVIAKDRDIQENKQKLEEVRHKVEQIEKDQDQNTKQIIKVQSSLEEARDDIREIKEMIKEKQKNDKRTGN